MIIIFAFFEHEHEMVKTFSRILDETIQQMNVVTRICSWSSVLCPLLITMGGKIEEMEHKH